MYFPMAPGWDQAILISGYAIDTISVTEENAKFSVDYYMIAASRTKLPEEIQVLSQ